MSTIVTRAGKGSALTHNEVDANFTNLNTDKLQSGNTAAALTITSATIAGGTINGTTVGATTPAAGTFTDLTANNSAVISVNTSGDALRITQTGTGNALVVEDSANPDSSPFVVDTVGRVITGIPATQGSVFGGGYNPQIQLWGTGPATASQSFASFNTAGTGNGSRMWLSRSRGSFTAGVPTYGIVSNGDSLGNIEFAGDDGTVSGAFVTAAQILAQVDGTPGTGDMPGRLVFSTTADGASSPTERMRITSSGQLLLNAQEPITANPSLVVGAVTTNASIILYRDDTSIVSANTLGRIGFWGNDSTSNTPASFAYIDAEASGTHAAGDNPTDIVFGTTNVGSSTPTDAVRIKNGGGLQITRTAVTAPAAGDGNVFSGTYTPSLANTTNITGSTPYACQYMRVGDVVTVSGRLNIDPTTSGAASELGISLPVASDITSGFQCAGTAAIYTTTTEVSTGGILGDTTNNRATFRFVAGGTAARDYGFTFTYLVN